MIDMGSITPDAATGPMRDRDGVTRLPRKTTTEEQRFFALRRITEFLERNSNRGLEVKATVNWSNGEPSILQVTFVREHIDGASVFLIDKVVETTLTGAEIIVSDESRLRTLNAELADLHENGML